MSHKSKVEFLKRATEKNFKTYLYFICTPDPQINISRVQTRVLKGGHDVPQDKIRNRFYRSLGLLYQAFISSQRAFVIDSTLEDDQTPRANRVANTSLRLITRASKVLM